MIERRLFWTGRVSRHDLQEALQVSEATAARLLRAYRDRAPGNMIYTPGGRRGYVASETFAPLSYVADYRDAGIAAQVVAPGLFDADHAHHQEVMRWVAKSLREKRALRIRYTDWNDRTTEREIQPVSWIALGESPVSLHAFCFLRGAWRSFDLDRMHCLGLGDRAFDAGKSASPEDGLVKISLNGQCLEVPQSCVYLIVARAYSSPRLRNSAMNRDIVRSVELANTLLINKRHDV